MGEYAYARMDETEIVEVYDKALEAFVTKAKEDRCVLAIILYGSLSYDRIWEKSDVNVFVIISEGARKEVKCLEKEVPFTVIILSRDGFKRAVESTRTSIFYRSRLSVSKLLYARDESIKEFVSEITGKAGSREKEIELIRHASGAWYTLNKASKWLYVKNDVTYSFLYIMFALRDLAHIEVYLDNQLPLREVLQQALKINPKFFQKHYSDLIQREKSKEVIEEALKDMYDYFNKRELVIYRPVLDFITKSGGSITQKELDSWFRKAGIRIELENLHERGIIERLEAPIRLTRKSTVEFNQPEYHFNPLTFNPKNLSPRNIEPTLENKIVEKKYEAAMESFLRKAQQDRYILAVMLGGSLSYDQVWEKSDLDVIIVTSEQPTEVFGVIENDIFFDITLFTRNQFKRTFERYLVGSIDHSVLSKSKLMLCKDETIEETFKDLRTRIGTRDLEIQLINNFSHATYLFDKAQKWLHIRKDPFYSFYYLLSTARQLAIIEVLMNGQIPLREVVQQALKLNPKFFEDIYTKFIHLQNINKEAINKSTALIENYLDERVTQIYNPIIQFIKNARTIVSHYELISRFEKKGLRSVDMDYVVRKGFIHQAKAPIRLTRRSTVEMIQPAYF